MFALVAAYLVSVLYVGLRSTQQLNVVHNRYGLLIPTSMGMAVADYYIINTIVSQSPWVILAFGLGGATGCAISMKLHANWRKHERLAPVSSQGVRDREPSQSDDPQCGLGHP